MGKLIYYEWLKLKKTGIVWIFLPAPSGRERSCGDFVTQEEQKEYEAGGWNIANVMFTSGRTCLRIGEKRRLFGK